MAEKCNVSNAAAVGAFRTSKLVFFFAQGSLSSFPSLIIFDLSAASDSIAHAILLHPPLISSQHDCPDGSPPTSLLGNTSSLQCQLTTPALSLLKLLNLVWSFFFTIIMLPKSWAKKNHGDLMLDVDDCSAPKIHNHRVIFDWTLRRAAFFHLENISYQPLINHLI